MKNPKTFKLIEGQFTAKDGREILTNVFRSKIEFHAFQNFSSQERFGKDDPVAVKRMPELRKSLDEIRELIDEAERNGEQLEIRSEVIITTLKPNQNVQK